MTITRFGRLAEIKWSICISKSQSSFFLDTFWVVNISFFVRSNLNFLHNSQWITFPTQLCLVLYSFCANLLLYSYLNVHASQRHSITDRRMNKRRMIMMQEGCRKEDTRRLLYNYIHLSFYCKCLKGLFKDLHVRGCWRPNVNFIFWPHCYDRHVVSLLFSWCWGLLHRGFPRAPSVWCGLPYHISSLTLWESAGNCIGGFREPPRSGVVFLTTSGLYCLEFYWQLLWDPNSTELNNNSTPTRSPTGSLKSNV